MHIWKNQDRYEGEWKQSLKSGYGTDIFANGDVYIGEYLEGKFCGKGKFIWHQGMVYEGEFKDGMRHGQGVWRESNEPNATSYDGAYYNDKKHGDGVYRWRSGSYYKGNFFNDQRDGYGEMFWIDGSSYKGQWENGAMKGEGVMNYADGTSKKIVQANTGSRNNILGNKNDFYNSKSFSQSDQKLPKHQRLISDTSSYSHDEYHNESVLTHSEKREKAKIKLFDHPNYHSANNYKLRMSKIYETARESSSKKYNNFMKIKEGHKRVQSK